MKILIVDDSKLARHQLFTLLKELGYANVVACENVRAAKTILASDEIHLILTDYNMPGESGLDLIRWVRSNPRTARTPMIMVTTVSEREKIVEAVKSGVQNYVFKPVQRKVLAEKLGELARVHGFSPPTLAAAPEPQPAASPATK